MTSNTIKKGGLFLSVVLVHGSMFGMLNVKKIKKSMSTLVFSRDQQKAIAIGLPVAVVVCWGLAQYKDEIALHSAEALDGIPDVYKKIASGAGALAGSSLIGYRVAGSLTAQERSKRLVSEVKKIEENPLIDIAKKAPTNAGRDDNDVYLKLFLSERFTVNPDEKPFSGIIATKKISKLKTKAEQLKKEMEAVFDSNACDDESKQVLGDNISVLEKHISSLSHFSAAITNLPDYPEDQKTYNKQQIVKMKQDQITWISKIATFIPMFIQPVATFSMVLLQEFLNLVKLDYRII